MRENILLTSPHKELSALAKNKADEIGIHLQIFEGALEPAVDFIKKKTKENDTAIDVIISRSGTAAMIKENVNLPVVLIEPSEMDILRSFQEAVLHGEKIGFLGFDYLVPPYHIKGIADILGIQVQEFLYRRLVDVKSMVEKISQLGIHVLVGGGIMGLMLAEQKGMKGVLVHTNETAIAQALEKAREIAEMRRRDRENSKWVESVVYNIHEGIITLDENGKIIIFNPAAEELFSVSNHKVLGKSLTDSSLPPDFLKLKDKGEKHNKTINLGKKKVIINSSPIYVHEKRMGKIITVKNITTIQKLEKRIRKEVYSKGLIADYSFRDIKFASPIMETLVKRAEKYAIKDTTILVQGESGTGKEMFAQALHNANPKRRNGPFVALNCATLPANLLESELFGYEEGAFSGARRGGKPGLFELAHLGTIFLDEIAEVPFSLQARLLRVLEQKEIMRLGGEGIIPVDVRIIAATNKNLVQAIKEDSFRKDLYYRLNILLLTIPPLRERKEDIPILVDCFLDRHKRRNTGENITVPKQIIQQFMQYQWSGNIRELENAIEKLVIFADEPHFVSCYLNELETEEMKWKGDGESGGIQNSDEETMLQPNRIILDVGTMKDMERQIIKQLKERTKSVNEIANILDVSRVTIWRKMQNKSDKLEGV